MSWTIRTATADEIPELVALRREMFEAMGFDEAAALDRTCIAAHAYFAEHMPTGAFRVWVAVSSGADADDTGREAGSGETGTCCGRDITPSKPDEGELIGSIGLVVHSVPPSPRNLVGRVGYIMNLVTLPAHRRKGIAGALLDHVLGVVRSEGIPVASLHATRIGRGIYERAGFAIDEELPEMRRTLS
ncbi:GNAT family N-acetyltransferase [Candidatus Bipolaricaulota bacterium]